MEAWELSGRGMDDAFAGEKAGRALGAPSLRYGDGIRPDGAAVVGGDPLQPCRFGRRGGGGGGGSGSPPPPPRPEGKAARVFLHGLQKVISI